MSEKWDLRFLRLAKEIATWSKDPSTKCGAVIVKDKFMVSSGFNGYAKGVADDESLLDRDLKYRKVLHAELNSILYAKQDLTGCTMYVYPMPPCARCAAAIIQSGIVRVVSIIPTEEHMRRWGSDIATAYNMFTQTGVVYEEFSKTTLIEI